MSPRPLQIARVKGAPVSDDDLLADLRRVAAEMAKTTVPQPKYRELGTYEDSTLSRRFGSWTRR
jgi:hypothetical protein